MLYAGDTGGVSKSAEGLARITTVMLEAFAEIVMIGQYCSGIEEYDGQAAAAAEPTV